MTARRKKKETSLDEIITDIEEGKSTILKWDGPIDRETFEKILKLDKLEILDLTFSEYQYREFLR